MPSSRKSRLRSAEHRPLVLREVRGGLRELLWRLHFGRGRCRGAREVATSSITIAVCTPPSITACRQVGEIELAIDDEPDEKRRDDRERCAFGRRDHAAEDAAEDDDRKQERPQRLARRCGTRGRARRRPRAAGCSGGRASRRSPSARIRQHARYDAGDEELDDEKVSAITAYEDHRDRRRDDHRERRGRRHHRGGSGAG